MMPFVYIELASERNSNRDEERDEDEEMAGIHLVSPGDIITRDVGFMRGHGTYMRGEDTLVASVAGVVQVKETMRGKEKGQ